MEQQYVALKFKHYSPPYQHDNSSHENEINLRIYKPIEGDCHRPFNCIRSNKFLIWHLNAIWDLIYCDIHWSRLIHIGLLSLCGQRKSINIFYELYQQVSVGLNNLMEREYYA